MKNFIIILILLGALVGVYFYFNQPEPTASNPTPIVQQPTSTNNPAPTPTPSAPATADIPPIDATWQTFSSRDGSLSFQYLPKGKFAPEWEQRYVASSDTAVKNGCFTVDNPTDLPARTLTVSGKTVCQTTYFEGAAGSTYRTDYVLIPKTANNNVMLVFTKRYTTDMHIVGNCGEGNNMETNPDCAQFNQTAYQATLEQILGTVQVK